MELYGQQSSRATKMQLLADSLIPAPIILFDTASKGSVSPVHVPPLLFEAGEMQ